MEEPRIKTEEHSFMHQGDCIGHTHKFTIKISTVPNVTPGQLVEVFRDDVKIMNYMILNDQCPRVISTYFKEEEGTQDEYNIKYSKEEE